MVGGTIPSTRLLCATRWPPHAPLAQHKSSLTRLLPVRSTCPLCAHTTRMAAHTTRMSGHTGAHTGKAHTDMRDFATGLTRIRTQLLLAPICSPSQCLFSEAHSSLLSTLVSTQLMFSLLFSTLPLFFDSSTTPASRKPQLLMRRKKHHI